MYTVQIIDLILWPIILWLGYVLSFKAVKAMEENLKDQEEGTS
jgi:hypothetical protein